MKHLINASSGKFFCEVKLPFVGAHTYEVAQNEKGAEPSCPECAVYLSRFNKLPPRKPTERLEGYLFVRDLRLIGAV